LEGQYPPLLQSCEPAADPVTPNYLIQRRTEVSVPLTNKLPPLSKERMDPHRFINETTLSASQQPQN